MIALALAMALAVPANASETRRIAVVVGSNRGMGDLPALHYAEADAGKVSDVLRELGGVKAEDLFLLQGRPVASLRSTLAAVRGRIAEWHRPSGKGTLTRAILLFYFSGHSDGASLEILGERLPFAELRQLLAASGAEVRVTIVDSCKSGAMLAMKGGRPGPSFQIHLTDDLTSKGEVILASSASDEIALESKEIHGSFFTNHLVSALRGAGDTSGDGRVTLSEAYRYAFTHTVASTADVLVGPQHPAYDYRLSGQGELVLSDLAGETAALLLPSGFDRALILNAAHDEVVAEVAAGAARRVALAPGLVSVRVWRRGAVYTGDVSVSAGATHLVAWSDLRPGTALAGNFKGESADGTLAVATGSGSASDHSTSLVIGLGGQSSFADGVGLLPALRVEFRSPRATGWMFGLQLADLPEAGYFESDGAVSAGYRLGVDLSAWQLYLGAELAVGVAYQRVHGSSDASPTASVAPLVGVRWALADWLALELRGEVALALLERNQSLSPAWIPAAWLGFATPIF